MQTHATLRYHPGVSDERDPAAAWRAVLLAQHRVVRAIERDLTAAGLVSLTTYDVLLELHGAPQRRLRMQELSERVVLSRSRVSRLVDELAAAGLVERHPDPDDGRATFACLTEAGRQALRRTAPAYQAGIERHFDRHLDDAERAAITRGLGRVVAAHEEGVPVRLGRATPRRR